MESDRMAGRLTRSTRSKVPGRAGQDRPLRVVVIGASLAGLFAAAAAAGSGHHVVVVERDPLPDTADPRPGVPQGQQPHVFLLRGLRAAEELLPGLGADLQSRGAVPITTSRFAWLGEQGWAPVNPSDFEIISLTRPLFEQVVRQRVLALEGVEVRDDCRVSGLRRMPSPEVHRWCVDIAGGGDISADLVVDASGRTSRMPVWLTALGIAPPKLSEVDAHTGYATRMYRDGPSLGGLSGIVLQSTPECPTGGLLLPVEHDRWLVLGVGFAESRPPRDTPGFEAFLRRLQDPGIADFAARSTPCGDVVVHRQTGNRRHHYEKVRDWPDDLLVMGDAMVAFNPVFGQGITVAACEALVLRDALGRLGRPLSARRVMREFAAVAAMPWNIAISYDLRQPSTGGRQSLLQVVTNAWARELSRLGIHGNERAVLVLNRFYHLLGKPVEMLHPALIWAALVARLRGYGPGTTRPRDLITLAGTPVGKSDVPASVD
jgi:2-polyprenyl-6-methoxyphenol hydroxylase-like FAD-dependent oxidoreductase